MRQIVAGGYGSTLSTLFVCNAADSDERAVWGSPERQQARESKFGVPKASSGHPERRPKPVVDQAVQFRYLERVSTPPEPRVMGRCS